MGAHFNVEIKAKYSDHVFARNLLLQKGARFAGTDHQVDTYFNCSSGRLKLREGNIENALIYYARPDADGPKSAEVNMMETSEGPMLKNVLGAALGIRVTVSKKREIYFIENVKFHLDTVEPLGTFLEIEAIDKHGTLGKTHLHEQCTYFMNLLGVEAERLIQSSYSEMLLALHDDRR